MADSSTEPAGGRDLLIAPGKEELSSTAEDISKDLVAAPATVAMATDDQSHTSGPVEGPASFTVVPLPAKAFLEGEESAGSILTPEPSENGAATSASLEEDSLSSLMSQIKTEGAMSGGLGQVLDQDIEEGSSVATAGGSEDQHQSNDSASFSSPMDVDEPLSSSYSALGVEGRSPSTEVPSLREEETLGAAGGATGGATAAAAAPEPEPSMPAYYLVKWITWKEKKTPIITQSENGPCPLLAIMNTLFLRWKAKLPAQTEVITTEDLMAHLGECVLSVTPREKAEELNFQQNMGDAMAVLPKLSTGLDVNVRFTGVTDFEYTPECIVFDLLDIPLYHGWLVDPQSPEMVAAVGKLSYNQLVEKIIDYKHSAESSRVGEGLVAEQFLESTATQLSYHGLCELNTMATEGEISVFFRNNHFSTMIKHKGHLYLLVTDQGFLQEEGLVWESLHNVEGDGNFCDSDFRLCHPPQRGALGLAQPDAALLPTAQEQQRQIDQDYLVAMSLQQQQGAPPGPLSDLELARQLQQEEYQQQQQQQQEQQQEGQQEQQQQQPGPQQAPQQVRGQASGQQGGARRREKESDCAIL